MQDIIKKTWKAVLGMTKQVLAENLIYNNFTMYPKVVNFPITGKCNMKCVMCNVWKKENQHHYEMTAKEIGSVFSQKLFKKVNHVGLSGGEPFARNDIDEIFEQIISNTSKLKGISIISNGTLTNKIIDKLPRIIDICKLNSKYFSIAFSIDGVGDIHNKVRGNDRSYENLIKTLDYVKGIGLKEYSLCCTITKYNIDNLWEILQFAKERGIYIKFRVATEITRLYNENLKDNFSFTRDEKIKIAKFYDKLVAQYEKKWHQKFYYMATKNQLINGTKRRTGCDWKNKGISLNAEGDLFYCFVKSPKLCNLLEQDGWVSYKNNINIRDNIIKNYCDGCIHDYVGSIDFRFLSMFVLKKIKDKIKSKLILFKLIYVNSKMKSLEEKRATINLNKKKDTVFITGWYGTETTGDKAIIAGIYNQILKYNSNANFIISSIVPYYTEETIKELGFKNTIIVQRNSIIEKKAIKDSDLIIMGGGPLMDIPETVDIMWAFARAIKKGVPTCVYSCGLGPLNINIFRNTTQNILKLSCYTFIRDENSIISYEDITKGIEITPNIDPAVAYLLPYKNIEYKENKKILACIRNWPQNYTKIKGENEFKQRKEQFLNKLCDGLILLINEGYQVNFFPMNTFYIGDDDRDYYDIIKKKLKGYGEHIYFYDKEYTTKETLDIFLQHNMIIGMRFHSVVFGNTLGIPTIAIDYDTNKGKIYGFMKSIGLEQNYISINDMINSDIFTQKIKNFDRRDTIENLYKFNTNLYKLINVPCQKIFSVSEISK